jgi:hypothetical protein
MSSGKTVCRELNTGRQDGYKENPPQKGLELRSKPFTRNVASGRPIRSIAPSRIRRSEPPASKSANLMLDDPPLIVRMRGLAGFMDDSFVIPQSASGQLGACTSKIGVKNASNPQALRDLDEHRGVVDVDYVTEWHLGDVQRQPKDVCVGLAEVDEAGGNNAIYKPVQFELANPMRIQFARFVADHDDLQPVPDLNTTTPL